MFRDFPQIFWCSNFHFFDISLRCKFESSRYGERSNIKKNRNLNSTRILICNSEVFRRYEKVFEMLASSGKSLFLVTHGLMLSSVASKASAESRRLVQENQPSMGDYLIFQANTSPEESSDSGRHRSELKGSVGEGPNHSNHSNHSNNSNHANHSNSFTTGNFPTE